MNLEFAAKDALRLHHVKRLAGGLGGIVVLCAVGLASYCLFSKQNIYAKPVSLDGQFDSNPSLIQTYVFTGLPPGTSTDGSTYDSDRDDDTQSAVLKNVAEVITKSFNAWNRRDLQTFLEQYLQTNNLTISFQLLSSTDPSIRITGRDTFLKECATYASDPSLMGHWVLKRMKVRILAPNVAYAFVSMHADMPEYKTDAIDAIVLILTQQGWKIAADSMQVH